MNQSNWVKVLFVDMTPVGSFQIFGVCSPEEANSPNLDLSNKIYWTDHMATQPIGPFPNVYEAAQSHVKMVLSRRVYRDQILLGNNPAFPEAPKTPGEAPKVKDNVTNMAEWKASKLKYTRGSRV